MNDYSGLYKKLLTEYSQFSTCNRLKVACLLVDDGRILSCGYNGVPSGDVHCEDKFTYSDDNGYYYIDGKSVPEQEWRDKHHEFSEKTEIHAEMNCLMYALKNKIDVSHCAVVISIAPCINCAKMILAAGIKTVYYVELYDRSDDGIQFLKDHGVIVRKI